MTKQNYKTRIGKLKFTQDFENGYPTKKTYRKLFDELDFQRACQAYLWAIPIVSFAQWQYAHNVHLGAKNGQIIYFESYEDKLGGLTYNVTTPYALPFIDLEIEGPFVVEMPEGEIRGAAHDAWQIGITQITEPGRYLFVGPSQKTPSGAEILRCFFILRCAVKRRGSSVGVIPTRQLSLQPVAIGAVVEVTKLLNPSVQKVTW